MSASRSQGLWAQAAQRLGQDRVGRVSLLVVALYGVMLGLSLLGVIGAHWEDEVAINYAPPLGWSEPTDAVDQALPVAPALDPGPVPLYGLTDPLGALWTRALEAASQDRAVAPPLRHSLLFGADKWGRSVALKVIRGSQTSIWVGLVAALVATLLGSLLGALAGYFGGWVDDGLNGLYGVFTAIPYLLLVFAIAAVLQQKGVDTLILILGTTGWTGVFRLVRAEYLKHRSREYVLAAGALGASHARRLFVHILPNASHVMLVSFSQNLVGFIKSEVILSFLGFGVPVDVVSWGSMLNEAQNELILGKWWQLAAAGAMMAIFVTAVSLLTDALRDALDPRLRH